MKNLQSRFILYFILLMNFVYMVMDIHEDLGEQASGLHIFIECFTAVITVGYLISSVISVRRLANKEKELVSEVSSLKDQANSWQQKNNELTSGLAQAIDEQLENWHLSRAEKDVTLLILKGLSYKEIAGLRNTTEQTIKQQMSNIYKKSKMANRSELMAYFMEDLLTPNQMWQ